MGLLQKMRACEHVPKKNKLKLSADEELTKDMPEVLRNAIQTGINNANKKAVSNAARVSILLLCSDNIKFFTVQINFI